MSNSKKRKLRAILFADIVGYTALMQKDEAQASELLQKFRHTLNEKVAQHSGEIINNYGDGCLCTFESAVDAMTCAKEVQLIFQAVPKVPVRIGLHSGDVFFEEDNVFGDSVNIASRIESLGVAGAVLFSKQIKRHIANQTEFKVQSLGEFDFKNVEKTMEVFGLANEGFVLPKREDMEGKLKPKKKNQLLIPLILGTLLLAAFGIWKMNASRGMELSEDGFSNHSTPLPKEVREKTVAVMAFDNQTNSEELKNFGLMASDWLTQGLMEVNEGEIVSAANVMNNVALAGVDNTSSEAFAKATNAEVIIQGRYYQQENQLIVHCNIIDAKTNKVIHALEPIQKDKKDAMKLLDELTQKILGYWMLSGNKIYQKKIPKYDAYQKLIESLHFYYSDRQKVESLLLQAYQLDTTFMQPLIRLAKYYTNNGLYAQADSILTIVKDKDLPLTDYETIRMKAIDARVHGQLEKSGNFNLQLAEKYDPAYYNNAIGRFVYANNLTKALEIVPKRVNLKDIDKIRIRQEGKLHRPLLVYSQLGNHHQVIAMMDTVFQYENNIIKFNRIPPIHLRAFIELDSMEAADRYLKFYLDKNNLRVDWANKAARNSILAQFCLDLYRIKGVVPNIYKTMLKENEQWLILHYINEDYEKCIPFTEAQIKETPFPISFIFMGNMGELYARLGQKAAADKWIKKIREDKRPFARGFDAYGEALIQNALGNKEKAVALLRKGHQAGLSFNPISYQNDPSLKELYDYLPFMEFVKPK